MTVYMGFDTETTPFTEGLSTELKLWCVYGEVYIKKRKLNFETGRKNTYIKTKLHRQHGYDTKSFEIFLQNLVNQVKLTREHHVLSAFNLPFDFYNIMPDLRNLDNVYTDGIIENTFNAPSFIILPVIISKRKKNNKNVYKKLYIIDLSNYTGRQWSLKGIAQAFNLPKKLHEDLQINFDELERDYVVTPNMIDYCYRDAEIVYKAMKIIDPAQYGRVKISASSLAFTDLQQRTGWRPFKRPMFAIEAEREAYFGGRVEVNPVFRGKQIRAVKFDVNSMYPSVMYDMKVPTKYIKKLTRKNKGYTDKNVVELIKNIYESNDLQANIKADIVMYKDCLPYRNNKNILEFKAKDKYISGFWTIEEFYPALRDLEIKIERVSSIFLYEAEKGLFNPFIDYWYDIKANAKDKILKNIAKGRLNHSYGKFAMREIREIDLYQELNDNTVLHMEDTMKETNFVDFIATNKRGELKKYKLRKIGNIIRTTEKTMREAPHKSTIIASIVGSRSRRKLWEVMRQVDWCYVDTDSITIPKYFLDSVDINSIIEFDKKKLGAWSVESCCKYDCQLFTFWNKKDYRCNNAFKLKGIPNKLINDSNYDSGIFEEYDRIVKPKEATVRNLPPYSIIKGSKQFKR